MTKGLKDAYPPTTVGAVRRYKKLLKEQKAADEETYCDCCKRPAEVKPFLEGRYCQGCIDYAVANMEDAE